MAQISSKAFGNGVSMQIWREAISHGMISRGVVTRGILLLFLPLLLVVGTDVKRIAAEDRVDFRNDIIPLLTKYGCNAGACHGAAIGRGGFKLSLYGGDPNADYDAIVRQMGGRRVNFVKPDESLLLLKPTEQVEHGGGYRFDADDEDDDEGENQHNKNDHSKPAQLLTAWIRQGAPNKSSRTLRKLQILPASRVVTRLHAPESISVMAVYFDGSRRDVTAWTVVEPEDASAVKVQEVDMDGTKTQTVTVLRRGRHLVLVRYLSEVVPIEFMVPYGSSSRQIAEEPKVNFVDDEILATLDRIGVPPSPQANDATLLRRVTLDLTGRLPAPEQVRVFLDSNNVEKREKLISQLLDSPEFAEYWTLQLAKWLRIRPRQSERAGARKYHQWLADQVATDFSYQALAQSLILSSGDTHEVGPANFHVTGSGPREQAEFFSELFMGSRLRCANCHNHPLDRWTQDDYHGLAAIFAKLERGRVVKENPRGETIHPGTLEPASPRIPGSTQILQAVSNEKGGFEAGDKGGDKANEFIPADREQLASWLTDAENPYFAKAVVNRLWKHMMGRGLVEPVDDFRATNPATHPKLLDQLADDFVENGYRIRHTLRRIAVSHAYRRSSDSVEANQDDDRFYSHASRRPLEPEVLSDAISDVLDVPLPYGDEPLGTRAVTLADPTTPSPALDILGRCDRSESCESTVVAAGGLSQKLHLLNGPLLNARIAAEGGRLRRSWEIGTQGIEADSRDADSDDRAMAIVEAFYLAGLSRYPTAAEQKHWKNLIQATDDPSTLLEDFVWALLTSDEFTTNH